MTIYCNRTCADQTELKSGTQEHTPLKFVGGNSVSSVFSRDCMYCGVYVSNDLMLECVGDFWCFFQLLGGGSLDQCT